MNFKRAKIFALLQPLLFAVVLFIFLLPLGVVIAFLANPGSIHEVRQADSLSFALNYFRFDYNFFHPQNFNLISEDGKCASEFPIYYYIAAMLSELGMNTRLALKLLHGISFYGALYFLWKKLKFYFSKNTIIASLVAAISILSTVVLYYSNNLLPDIAALSLTLVGIALVYFSNEVSKKEQHYAIVLFALASMIKITYGIYPLAFLGAQFLLALKNRNGINRTLIQGLLFFIPVASWWMFVKEYNIEAGNNYYFNTFLPIWESSADQRHITLDHILHYWRNSYYPESTQYLFALSSIGLVFFTRQITLFRKLYLSLTLLGVISFIILFFEKFRDHDYYFLVIVPLIIFTIVEFIHQVQNGFYFKNKTRVIYALLGVVAIGSYSYVLSKLPHRIAPAEFIITKPSPEYLRFQNASNQLNAMDQSHAYKILVIGDSTMNNSLVKFERKGWQFPLIPVVENDKPNEHSVVEADAIFTLKNDLSKQPEVSEILQRNYREATAGLWIKKETTSK